jgi:acetyl esterase/lipase
MRDGARAIQFLRSRASELGIDSRRIAACGNSAGAGISLWVGLHDDLAEPASADMVLRQSSRLACVGVVGAQTSYDPRFIRQLIGGRAHEHVALKPLFGITSDADADSPRLHRLYEDASPLTHVSTDDPPVILFYSEPNVPLPADARPGAGIHHPRFGEALKASLDRLGVECVLRHKDDYRGQEHPEEAMYDDLVGFFRGHLRK